MAKMGSIVVAFLFIALISPGYSTIFFEDLHPTQKVLQEDKDYGEPLFLTPYIESGRLEEARQLSRTGPLQGTNVVGYSGYLTVKKQYDSNMFFWFFPALNGNIDAPVVLWLQGGPGSSSMYGLFAENGPFYLDAELQLHDRPYTWANEFNLLFIDNPVGTGFSFTNSSEGYANNEDDVGNDLYEAMQQFLTLFYELRPNEFYVTGESYAGKYVPALGHAIHNKNPSASEKVNLAGLAIGDGLIDPAKNCIYGDFLYNIGAIDDQQLLQYYNMEARMLSELDAGDYLAAQVTMNLMVGGAGSLLYRYCGYRYYYNYLRTIGPDDDGYYSDYLSLEEVRNALHVGNLTFSNGLIVYEHLLRDFMQSSKPWVEELLDAGYKVLIYNGQLDIIVNYLGTVHVVGSLNWTHTSEYLSGERIIWKVEDSDTEVAGYVKQAHNLQEIVVRNAGHILPYDQPRAAYDMITRFVFNEPFINGKK